MMCVCSKMEGSREVAILRESYWWNNKKINSLLGHASIVKVCMYVYIYIGVKLSLGKLFIFGE